MTSTALVSEPSWGETLRAYNKERQLIPWGEQQPEKRAPVEKYNQNKPIGRVFNPVLMKFTDKDAEARRSEQEMNRTVHQLNQARDKQLLQEQKFHIINHRPHVEPTEKSLSQKLRDVPKIPDSRVDYNIVSHKPKSLHMGGVGAVSIYPPDEDPARELGGYHPTIDKMVKNGDGLPQSHNLREFNVISNRYHVAHEERERNDYEQTKRDAQVTYWRTHNYDPVVGRYYDNDKESEYKKQLKALEGVQGSCQLARLPPSIQYSEGAAYNILSHGVKDEQKLTLSSGVGNRAVRSKKGSMVEAEIRDRAEELENLVESRSMGRISQTGHMREREEGRHRGYDVITNESFLGRERKTKADSRLKRPETVWSKLHSGTELSMGTSVRPARARDLTGGDSLGSPELAARAETAAPGMSSMRSVRPPTVPALKMPSNITQLQNDYTHDLASAVPTPAPALAPKADAMMSTNLLKTQSVASPQATPPTKQLGDTGVRTGGFK